MMRSPAGCWNAAEEGGKAVVIKEKKEKVVEIEILLMPSSCSDRWRFLIAGSRKGEKSFWVVESSTALPTEMREIFERG